MKDIITKISADLEARSDSKTRESGQNFFKEKILFHGVKTQTVTVVAKEHYKNLRNNSKKEIFELCEMLWQSGYMEESFIACQWADSLRKQFEPADFEIFEKWISNYVTNWASCDTFCNHTMGDFIMMYPEFLKRLLDFTKSSNRWVRRAAAVSLIVPARQGKFLQEVFQIADLLLTDQEDMVQKGYGWMLKVASHTHEQEVFDYVYSKKAIMPRTALRYAIEKMSPELKRQAMSK